MIETIIIISLICTGINVVGWKGMLLYNIFNWIENIIKKMVGEKIGCIICDPLFRCILCQASFWTIITWFYKNCSFDLIPVIFAVCGLNTIILAIIKPICPENEDG